ncbi:MAG: hypothetical protein B7Z55_01320 [Planctomycetales bacterium 12-60-4]|nr:MAG: hypothetical protein B7Z55_01320 [Planctomycetales bacterium 12-60-4]
MTETSRQPTDSPSTEWERFEALVRAARNEPAPIVNVVMPVLRQISTTPPPSLLPRQSVVLWGAGVSALVAASLLVAAWTATQTMTDPAAGWFQPFKVALLERP